MTWRQWLCVFGFHRMGWEWSFSIPRVHVYACRLCGWIDREKSYGG